MRWTLAAIPCLALAGAAVLVTLSEKHVTARRDQVRTFAVRARDAADQLSDLRVAQQAYVAAGQGIAYWMPKVTSTSAAAAAAITSLKALAQSDAAKSAVDAADQALGDFSTIDARAREYLRANQELMAADVIFTEGGNAAAAAARQVEAARAADEQAFDAAAASARRIESAAAGAAAALSAVLLLFLARTPRARVDSAALGIGAPRAEQYVDRTAAGTTEAARARSIAAAPQPAGEVRSEPAARQARAISPVLATAAALCTDFGRARDVADLNVLLGRAADVMDASGLIIWVGAAVPPDNDRLRPVLAHGYSPAAMAKMPPVPRNADNAAAAAYRTGALQIVLTRPGVSAGAVVAPLLAADGCVGALSVEVRSGGEGSDSVQALAAIFAAQLAPVVSASFASVEDAHSPVRAASQ